MPRRRRRRRSGSTRNRRAAPPHPTRLGGERWSSEVEAEEAERAERAERAEGEPQPQPQQLEQQREEARLEAERAERPNSAPLGDGSSSSGQSKKDSEKTPIIYHLNTTCYPIDGKTDGDNCNEVIVTLEYLESFAKDLDELSTNDLYKWNHRYWTEGGYNKDKLIQLNIKDKKFVYIEDKFVDIKYQVELVRLINIFDHLINPNEPNDANNLNKVGLFNYLKEWQNHFKRYKALHEAKEVPHARRHTTSVGGNKTRKLQKNQKKLVRKNQTKLKRLSRQTWSNKHKLKRRSVRKQNKRKINKTNKTNKKN